MFQKSKEDREQRHNDHNSTAFTQVCDEISQTAASCDVMLLMFYFSAQSASELMLDEQYVVNKQGLMPVMSLIHNNPSHLGLALFLSNLSKTLLMHTDSVSRLLI